MENNTTWTFDHSLAGDQLTLQFAGNWESANNPPEANDFAKILEANPSTHITLKGDSITHFDSHFVASLLKFYREAQASGISINKEAMPTSLSKLLDLALSTKPHDTTHTPRDESVFARTGRFTIKIVNSINDLIGMVNTPLQRLVLSGMGHKMGRRHVRAINIGVGPITIPKYLEQPEIVTREYHNELRLAEFH